MKTITKTLTRAKAIRARCLDCAAGNDAEVRRCELTDCPLYRLRMGRGVRGLGGLSKPIRAFCLKCMNGQQVEVRLCQSEYCALFDFRMGHRAAVGPLQGTIPGVSTSGAGGRARPATLRPATRVIRDGAMTTMCVAFLAALERLRDVGKLAQAPPWVHEVLYLGAGEGHPVISSMASSTATAITTPIPASRVLWGESVNRRTKARAIGHKPRGRGS